MTDTKEITAGIAFIRDCLHFAEDEDLKPMNTLQDAADYIDYFEDQVDEMPAFLKNTSLLLVCWNQAVSEEIEWRKSGAASLFRIAECLDGLYGE